MHAKVHHPGLVRISEIFSGLGKRTEGGWSGFLLPNGLALARWCERNSQVLQVPVFQRFWIMSSEEQPSDSATFSISVSPRSWLADTLPSAAGLAGCAVFCTTLANSSWGKMKLDPKVCDKI